MLGFQKTNKPPVFELALYDDDIPCEGIYTRKDVPGYTTFLMELKGKSYASVNDDRLAELGLTPAQAWEQALATSRGIAEGMDDQQAQNVPGLLIIGGTDHNAIPSTIIHWELRPELQGAAGTYVVLLEKHLAIALKVEDAEEIGSSLDLFVGLLAQHVGSEDGAALDGVRLLWKDTQGWEFLTIRVGEESIDFECSDRMRALFSPGDEASNG